MSDLPPQQLGRLDPSKRITFVHQRACSGLLTEEKEEAETLQTGMTGSEARNFYESLLNEPSTSAVKEEELFEDEIQPIKPAPRRKTKQYPELNDSDKFAYLKAAQEGNIKLIEEYLAKGMPIDIMDEFYWTPLMIAAAAGKESTCRYLISRGANYNLVNGRDQTVFDVLDEQKNLSLLERLINYITELDRESPGLVEVQEDIFCAVCQRRYPGSTIEHLTSTLHIYNEGKRGTTHSGIMIPETNIGYQLLIKKGWTEEKGLGKSGEGHRFPVRTILKRNRTGLGLEKLKKKVTHFQPNDVRAVQSERRTEVAKGSWKKEMKKKQQKESRIARNFRNAFNQDDSVAEYLGL